MHKEIKARLDALREIIDISRTRNVVVIDRAESNINSLKLISQSIDKLEIDFEDFVNSQKGDNK